MERTRCADAAAVTARVLETIGELVAELRQSPSRTAVTPSDSLQRDLDLHSLERLELVLRLERDLDVHLDEAVVAAAERPADLVAAVIAPDAVARSRDGAPVPARRAARHGNSSPPPAGSLLFTSYVSILLLLSGPLLWIALLLLPAGLAPQRVIRWYFRRLVQASGCRVHVHGLEYLRRSGPAVLVLNHQSYVDGAVVVAALPTGFRFLLKRQLEAYPLIGTAVRKCGHLLVDRASWDDRLAAADRLVDALRRGDSILVFPESTLARGPALLPFRLGAFRAAVESGCPVIPIAVRGTREILPQGRWLLRRGVVHVTIGEPIEAKGEGWRESLDVRCRARAAIERDLSAASAGNGAAGV